MAALRIGSWRRSRRRRASQGTEEHREHDGEADGQREHQGAQQRDLVEGVELGLDRDHALSGREERDGNDVGEEKQVDQVVHRVAPAAEQRPHGAAKVHAHGA